jgi:VanZ family protein
MAVLFALSSIPGAAVPEVPLSFADKLVHIGLYAVLGALLWRALAAGGSRKGNSGARALLLAWLLSVLYGASDELHQRYVPGRTPDVRDLAADATGALAGIFTARWLARRRQRGERTRTAGGET